jgi:hypothetical protein
MSRAEAVARHREAVVLIRAEAEQRRIFREAARVAGSDVSPGVGEETAERQAVLKAGSPEVLPA